MLAIHCAEEARTVKPASKGLLYSVLEQGIEDVIPERRTIIAQALLKRRLRQMRPLQEGIFVDTSLLSCAEYQVFVDEQRLQGQQVAPDVWSVGIFPSGLGNASVLGVRCEDAQQFCGWLTSHDREGHFYRLPSAFCSVVGRGS